MRLYFKDTPFNLICFDCGNDVVSFLAQAGAKAPDLFLLDTTLEDMSGYDLAHVIRKVGLRAPILFLLADPSRKEVVKALESGASDIIVKTSTKEQILERVRKHI